MSRPAWFGNEPDIIITARKNRALAKRRKERDEQAKGSAMTQDTEDVVARAMCFADYDIVPLSQDEFWNNPHNNHWLMQEADEWDNGILTRLGREGYRRHARAALHQEGIAP